MEASFVPAQRVTIIQRVVRAAIGICIGWVVCSFTCLFWLGALMVWYGDLEVGLSTLKQEWWSTIAFAALFGSMFGSWTGCIVAPALLGPTTCRRPIITSSLLGGVYAALMSSIIGATVEWIMWEPQPINPLWMPITILLGVVTGVYSGRRVARRLTTTNTLSRSFDV